LHVGQIDPLLILNKAAVGAHMKVVEGYRGSSQEKRSESPCVRTSAGADYCLSQSRRCA
jgi:hypothetical protein